MTQHSTNAFSNHSTEDLINKAKTAYCCNYATEWLLWELACRLEDAVKLLNIIEIRQNE